MTKACTNHKCPAYAHFVYTVAMRCVLCRWDLKSAQRISDAVADGFSGAKTRSAAASGKSGGTHVAR
ncbi:MAG TPA: hypothetical protein VGZ91_04245 [Candidatus Sulfotelmatobacter sp.]|jgi:hypothetical protein|nr:hypothetical protein [Candidatus Sulfotelmatobacter sp.]